MRRLYPHPSFSPVPSTSHRLHPRVLATLAVLLPACGDASPDDIDGTDPVADEITETMTEEEVTERFGGDPSVSEPDPIEMQLLLDPTAIPEADDIDELSQALDPSEIADETASIWQGVQRVTNFYHQPRYAEAAWASPDTPGCSSTMIGPNLLITAAHCSADTWTSITANGRVYRERDLGQRLQENFSCSLLFHTFPETDMAIYHCPPQAGQLSLGDRFGWVDVEATEVTQGDVVYSVFSNPIDSLGSSLAHHLLSLGTADIIGITNNWANPNSPPGSVIVQADQAVNQIPRVVQSSVWTNPGASGSVQFNWDGRALIGPLSTGTADSALRRALPMVDYLYYGWIYERQTSACPWTADDSTACSTDNSVNGNYVSSLGLDPTQYEGTWADQDLDYFFDLPADVSDLEGENRRDVYTLRFSSRQQNRLWQAGPASSIEHDGDGLSFDTTDHQTSAWVELARHEQLNLEPLSTYSVTLNLDSEMGYYRLCTEDGGLSCTAWFFENGNAPTAHTLDISVSSGEETLILQGWNARGSIESVTLTDHDLLWTPPAYPGGPASIDEVARLDFDAFDDRNAWYDPDSSSRPQIYADGVGTGVDWAGRLQTSSSTTGYDYDLATDALPIADGSNTVCFLHRRDPAIAWSSLYVYMRIERQDGSYVTGRFAVPGTNWAEACHTFNASVATGEALQVRFGIYGTGSHSGAAFIDEVEVELP